MAQQVSRLEKLYFRLEAQVACLAWAFREIENRPGIVFELGLGHGRTFDHLRKNLPAREIYVFDRRVDSYPDCTPDADHIIPGELSQTLPVAASRFAGKVVLAHCDVGSFSAEHNTAMIWKLVRSTSNRLMRKLSMVLLPIVPRLPASRRTIRARIGAGGPYDLTEL